MARPPKKGATDNKATGWLFREERTAKKKAARIAKKASGPKQPTKAPPVGSFQRKLTGIFQRTRAKATYKTAGGQTRTSAFRYTGALARELGNEADKLLTSAKGKEKRLAAKAKPGPKKTGGPKRPKIRKLEELATSTYKYQTKDHEPALVPPQPEKLPKAKPGARKGRRKQRLYGMRVGSSVGHSSDRR